MTMLRRTGFKKPERPAKVPALLRPLERPVNYASISANDAGPAVAKEVKAKPGKRAPNKSEQDWMNWIVAYGCIACRMDGNGIVDPCVHHIIRGGRRIGHHYTLPLCPGHHQEGTGIPGLIARHPHKARFEAKYGSEHSLLSRLQSEYGASK